MVFWDIITCSSEKKKHLSGTYCLHFQGQTASQSREHTEQAGLLLGFIPEYKGDMFLWNIWLPPSYLALESSQQYAHQSLLWVPKNQHRGRKFRETPHTIWGASQIKICTALCNKTIEYEFQHVTNLLIPMLRPLGCCKVVLSTVILMWDSRPLVVMNVKIWSSGMWHYAVW